MTVADLRASAAMRRYVWALLGDGSEMRRKTAFLWRKVGVGGRADR